MVDPRDFKAYTIIAGNVHIEVDLKRYRAQYERAQWFLGEQVLHDCKPLMPHRTGSLQQRSHVEEGGRRVVFPGPYARFLYGGKVMIDPDTGSPWARKGAKKVLTDRPLTFISPTAKDHWFAVAKEQHCEEWISIVKRIAGGGMNG